MKRSELDLAGEALRARKLSQEDVEASIGRVWSNLRPPADSTPEEFLYDLRPIQPVTRRMLWIGFAAAAVAIVAFGLSAALWLRGPFAVVESGALEGGWRERVRFGDILRSNGPNGSVLRLADGSRIEIRSQSEIRLESAADGVAIRLNSGSVIVTAAPQRSGHLYVQTRDVTVSVVGTVFMVNAEADGSRVAVIEGLVHVRQGAIERKLLPGEQVVTAPSMGSLSLGEGLSWSRNVVSHLALLQKSVVALPRASSTPLAFEAAAIKPSGPDSPPLSITSSPGRLLTSNTSLRMLITWAYDISSDRLIGAPKWLDDVRFDIHATVTAKGPGEEPGRERLKLMMQSLLAERFKLLFHRETREMATYGLAVDKGGLKVQLRDAGNDLGRNTFNMPERGRLVGTKVNSVMLAKVLADQLGREVEDRTGLSGIFDFTLEWAPHSDAANVAGRPSIFTAVREQLGLELLARKGPVEVLVIDQIDRSPAF